LSVALLVPLLIGVIAERVIASGQPGEGGLPAVLRGYPYTLGLALTLVLMSLAAPALKIRDMLRRWESQHVAVLVSAEDYDDVLTELERALARGGIRTVRRPASALLRVPSRILAFFARKAVQGLVVERLTT